MYAPMPDPLVDTFYNDGFVVVRQLFTSSEIDRMREAFERLAATARRLDEPRMVDGSQFVVDVVERDARVHRRIHRVVWCGAAEPVLSDFGRDPRLVDLAARLLSSARLEQLINQAHFKFPGDGVSFDWHQDSRHRRYGSELWTDVDGRGSFVETATAIDPMTRDNGPLKFIPGSNRLGHLPVDPHTQRLPQDSFDASRAVTLTMEPGDVVAFGPYVIHGSEPNASSHPRRLFLNGFAIPGANRRVYPGDGAGRSVYATCS